MMDWAARPEILFANWSRCRGTRYCSVQSNKNLGTYSDISKYRNSEHCLSKLRKLIIIGLKNNAVVAYLPASVSIFLSEIFNRRNNDQMTPPNLLLATAS